MSSTNCTFQGQFLADYKVQLHFTKRKQTKTYLLKGYQNGESIESIFLQFILIWQGFKIRAMNIFYWKIRNNNKTFKAKRNILLNGIYQVDIMKSGFIISLVIRTIHSCWDASVMRLLSGILDKKQEMRLNRCARSQDIWN